MTRSPWAREYARKPNAYIWGTSPSPFARKVRALLPRGARVLDLGCGEGRDSVFFATQGFDVTGLDISRAGLRKAERLARAHHATVHWVHGDMARAAITGPFDLVYSCGTIHYVPRRQRSQFFSRLQALTGPGGYHAHIVFTDRVVYVEKREVIDYFVPGELRGAYADWPIIECHDTIIGCQQDGTRHRHSVERLIARALGP